MSEQTLTPAQQQLLAVWQQHTFAEFVQRDAAAALATMSDDPYVLLIPAGTGGVGRDGVYDFYANAFLPNIPQDMENIPISQTITEDKIIEEAIFRFTHNEQVDWMIPGVPATGKKVEMVVIGLIQFKDGKVAHEHLYWDQATVLTQLGVVDHPAAAAGQRTIPKLREIMGL